MRERVPYVFTLCGHGNVGLLDALYDRTDAIRTITIPTSQFNRAAFQETHRHFQADFPSVLPRSARGRARARRRWCPFGERA